MNYITVGKDIYPGMIVEIKHLNIENLEKDINSNEIFKIVKINSGSGIVKINGKVMNIIAPAVLCIGNQEIVEVVRTAELKVEAFYFHPKIINTKFDFDNIVNSSCDFTRTESQDRYWLCPFFDRSRRETGYIPLGPAAFRKLDELFDKTKKELDGQADWFWPCRGRSLFIELLFITHKLYFETDETKDKIELLGESDNEWVNIVIYLNINYSKKITISEITKLFGTNRTTLGEKFNKIMGVSVIGYLNRLRIQIAAGILRDTTIPVTEIMYRVGFNDPAHFGRVFKKNMGYSPAEYRKEYNWLLA